MGLFDDIEESVEARLSIMNAHHMIASKIPTLQYLSFGPAEPMRTYKAWWQVFPSQRSKDDSYRLQRLSEDQGRRVRTRLWDMDAESLVNFDISKLNA